MHETTDYDGNKTYYLTGNPNNWVSFAGKLWRIVRVNGDNSVRILYAGSGGEDGYIGTTGFSSNTNDPMYVGWKYGTTGSLISNRTNINSSNIYNYIKENWYDKLTDEEHNFINMEAIYCNDRRIESNSTYSTVNNFNYISYSRTTTPTLTCDKDDQFKDGYGLITSDEIFFAGGKYLTESTSLYYRLNKSGGSSTGTYSWWTMTPWYFRNGSSHQLAIRSGGSSGKAQSGDSLAVRPVVSLKPNVLVTGGSGTGSDPYTVTMP